MLIYFSLFFFLLLLFSFLICWKILHVFSWKHSVIVYQNFLTRISGCYFKTKCNYLINSKFNEIDYKELNSHKFPDDENITCVNMMDAYPDDLIMVCSSRLRSHWIVYSNVIAFLTWQQEMNNCCSVVRIILFESELDAFLYPWLLIIARKTFVKELLTNSEYFLALKIH